jgi:hypothetical protein
MKVCWKNECNCLLSEMLNKLPQGLQYPAEQLHVFLKLLLPHQKHGNKYE